MSKYWPYLLLVYVATMLLFPVVFSASSSFFIKQDNLHQAYPWYNKLAISLHKGYLPVWDANIFGGRSFAGEPQTGIFYPVNIIWCLVFGSVRGIRTYWLDLLVAIHYLLCLFGMYRLTQFYRLSIPGSIASALIFSFAGAVGARAAGQTCIFFGLCWLPWGVYCTARYFLGGRRWRWLGLAGTVGALQILSGHIQPFFHTVMIDGVMVLYYSLQGGKGWGRRLMGAALAFVSIVGLACILSLPQLYYMLQYLARCYRTVSYGVFIGPGQKVPEYIYSHWFIIHPANLLNFLGQQYSPPDDDNILYMGILPLFLAALYLTWFRSRKTSPEHAGLTRISIILLTLGLLCVSGHYSQFYLILYKIPFVNLVRQLGRYIILIHFSLAILTGLGITYLAQIREWMFRRSAGIRIYAAGLLAAGVILAGWTFPGYIPDVVWILFLLGFLFLLWIGTGKWRLYWPFAAAAIIFIDLLLNPVGYLPTASYFYPDRFYARNAIIDSLESSYGKYRVDMEMKNYALMRRNLGDLYAIQTRNGYGATIDKAYADFLHSYGGSPLDSGMANLLNVRYLITDMAPGSGYIYRDSTDYLKLYERRNWYPRCYWKRQLGESGHQIEAENKNEIRQVNYTDAYELWQVECLKPDTLVFSENWYPGWTCCDNGKVIPIYQATIAKYSRLFRSIALEPGHHLIEFRYRNPFHWF